MEALLQDLHRMEALLQDLHKFLLSCIRCASQLKISIHATQEEDR